MTLDVVSGCHMGTRTTFSHSSTAHTGAILHGCLVHPAPATWLRQPCSKHAVRGSSQAAGGRITGHGSSPGTQGQQEASAKPGSLLHAEYREQVAQVRDRVVGDAVPVGLLALVGIEHHRGQAGLPGAEDVPV